MNERNPIDEPFPWLAVLGALIIVLAVIGVALYTGTCSTDMPC